MTKSGQGQRARIRPLHYASSRDAGLPAEIVSRTELLARFSREFLEQPERLHFHILVAVQRGRGFHWVDFERLSLGPRELLYIAPGQVQRYDLSRSFQARLLVLPAAARLWGSRGASSGGRWRLSPEEARDFARSFDELELEQERFDGSRSAKELIRAHVQVVRRRLERLPGGVPGDDALPALFREFEELAERGRGHRRSAAELARQLGCSPRTLSRVVQAARGLSPKAYLDQRTALEAKRLLAYRDEKTAVLAEELGFSEVTHFVRFFRRLVGETPASFRARWSRSRG